MITNQILLNHAEIRTDYYYVLTSEPIESKDSIVISVDLEQQVAVLDEYAQLTDISVANIRSGRLQGLWLLSGGTVIIQDAHPPLVALGIRDANAADPFTFTNIGAGRCDQKLFAHCLEELASEFILCVRDNGLWHQVNFGAATRAIKKLYKSAVQKGVDELLQSDTYSSTPIQIPIDYRDPFHHKLFRKVTIHWGDGAESLYGYVWLDWHNQTTEFRLPVVLNLSHFQSTCIFFGEGTGYALWKSIQQIRALVAAEKEWETDLVTPFLKQFVQ